MRGQERNASGPERQPPPGPQFFSTNFLPPSERVAFMRYTASELLVGRCEMDRLEDADGFRVDIKVADTRQLRLHHTRNLGLSNTRTLGDLADDVDDVVLLLGVGGEGLIDQDDRRCRLRPNDVVLVDFSRPVVSLWPDCEMLVMQMPRQMLGGVDPRVMTATTLDGNRPLVPLLHAYARAALSSGDGAGLPEIAERHLAELAAELCRSASRSVTAADDRAAIQAGRVAAMRETLARSYRNPCLTMEQVAASVGLSERSGHLHFSKAGLSFTEELQALRLDRAHERLAATGGRVIDVAFDVGFSDASHFHRLFKRRFGCTPAERRETASPSSGRPANP